MTTHQYTIGVDLGGQSLKLGLVDQNGTIHLRQQSSVEPAIPAPAIAELLINQIEHIQKDAQSQGQAPTALGIVMPGYMDRNRTRIIFAANLPTLSGSDFLSTIKKAFDLPIIFDADCNAAAWGEYRFGAGQSVHRLIVTTIGTGIGAGVIVDGEILRTFHQVAGSLGHVVIDAQGPKCKCGGYGCLESKAAGPALEKLAADLAQSQPNSKLAHLLNDQRRITARDIGLALSQNDPVAQQAVTECGWWLGAGIASWSVIYNPQKVIIGGGLAGLGEPWLSAVRSGFKQVAQPTFHETVTIEPAALAQDAGIIGAAALATKAFS